MKQNNKKYIFASIITTLLITIGVSYAYWLANINGSGANLSVSFGDVKIIFTDTTEIVEEEVVPPWSTSKTFTVKNEGNKEFFYDINIKNLINTLVTEDYLQYKITSTNGYNMTDYKSINKSETPTIQTLGNSIKIEGGETQEYTIEFRYVDDPNVDQSADMGKRFGGNLDITKASISLYSQLLLDNPTRTGARPNAFSGIYSEENTGVMYVANGSQTEDGSNVYYFAGNALNNWVKFGKNEQDEDLYWRIIRTNEDGSVRLFYAGTSPDTTEGYINGSQAYSSAYNDPMYVGYMYGTTGSLANNRKNTNNSEIKTVVDNWYASGLNAKIDASGNIYDAYISKTAIYCNDRANEGYNLTDTFYYAAYHRLLNSKSPSYKCGNDKDGNLYTGTNGASNADKFSKSTSEGGNGQLEYPVALITADELSFAGGVDGTNSPTWYHYNSVGGSTTGTAYWWTMTPSRFTANLSGVFLVGGSSYPGYLNYNHFINEKRAIRPVISLKSCTTWKSGNGDPSTPYEVEINNSCVLSEN